MVGGHIPISWSCCHNNMSRRRDEPTRRGDGRGVTATAIHLLCLSTPSGDDGSAGLSELADAVTHRIRSIGHFVETEKEIEILVPKKGTNG